MAKVSIVKWITNKIKQAMAIVQDGDTATRTISSGKYVLWNNNMYTANSNIASGDDLSSKLTACADGGLNELSANTTQAIANLLDVPSTNQSAGAVRYRDCGGFIYILITEYSTTISAWSSAVVGTIPVSDVGKFVGAETRGFQNTSSHTYGRGSCTINGQTGAVTFLSYEDALTNSIPLNNVFFLPKIKED